jgi:hypothetical protein
MENLCWLKSQSSIERGQERDWRGDFSQQRFSIFKEFYDKIL